MNTRYRLAITVTRGDARAEIIQAIARGTQAAFLSCEDARVAQGEFHRLAGLTDTLDLNNFACYGASLILDEERADVINARVINGFSKKST